jgi:hypothetical protein
MSCAKCDGIRQDMRVHALKLAVEAASISQKIDFESTADSYFNWLMKSNSKPQKKELT